MEKFKCGCGFIISVEFSEKEISRDVPCGGCYYEEWDIDKGKITFGNIIKCNKGKGI